MLEKEKYYSEVGNVKKNILLEAGYILCMIYLFGFTVDYSNINIPYFVLLFMILLFGILTMYIHCRNRKGKYYIFYEENYLYMIGIFGSIKKIDMTNGYSAKKFKNKIHYIVVNNASGKGEMLIGGQYKEHFSKLVDLLETKQK